MEIVPISAQVCVPPKASLLVSHSLQELAENCFPFDAGQLKHDKVIATRVLGSCKP